MHGSASASGNIEQTELSQKERMRRVRHFDELAIFRSFASLFLVLLGGINTG